MRPHREELRSFLPYDEVRAELQLATRRSDDAERAVAYANLIRCAGRSGDPGAFADALSALGRVANDQDRVHAFVFSALQEVPAPIWSSDHLEPLTVLIDGVHRSPWRSTETEGELMALVKRLTIIGCDHHEPVFTEFGMSQLERMCAEFDDRQAGRVIGALPRPVMVKLCRRLAPALHDEAKLGKFRRILAFADALGTRVSAVPAIEAILRQAVFTAEWRVAREAAEHWLSPGATRSGRVADLVASRHPAATTRRAFEELTCTRTDLLATWLRRGKSDSAASTGALLRPLSRSATRSWPPRLQQRYLTALESLATDRRRTSRERGLAIRAMSRLPELRATQIEGFLGGQDPLVGLAALATLDVARPLDAVWPRLAEALETDAALVAAIGMGRLARRIRPERLAERLTPLMDLPRIAARKQAARTMVRHGIADGLTTARRLWDDAALPTAVRESLIAEFILRLDEPDAARMVMESPAFPEAATPALGLDPLEVPTSMRSGYADMLVKATESESELIAERATARLGDWAGWSASVESRLVKLTSDLNSARWRSAAAALADLAKSGHTAPLREAVARLREAEADQPDAEIDRDLPVDQRCQTISALLAAGARDESSRAHALAIIDQLPSEAALELRAGLLAWDADAVELGAFVRDVPDLVGAVRLAPLFRDRMYTESSRALPSFCRRLMDLEDERGAVLAAALIGRMAAKDNWSEPWRLMLRELRTHPSPAVRGLALREFTATE
jgi:hypothetical protein